MADIRIPFGWRQADDLMVSIQDAERGIACGLHCPVCQRPLVARKGEVLRHHFAHASECECSGALESALHKMAKQVLLSESGIMAPSIEASLGRWIKQVRPAGWSILRGAQQEKAAAGALRPDVTAYMDDARVAIEVLVTHPCSLEKARTLGAEGLQVLELDLSACRRDDITEPELREAIRVAAPRHWLFHAEAEAELARMIAWRDAKRAQEEADRERARRREEEQRRAYEAESLRLIEEAQRKEARRREELAEQARRRAEAMSSKPALPWSKHPEWQAAEAERQRAVARGTDPMVAGLLMGYRLHTGSGPFVPRMPIKQDDAA